MSIAQESMWFSIDIVSPQSVWDPGKERGASTFYPRKINSKRSHPCKLGWNPGSSSWTYQKTRQILLSFLRRSMMLEAKKSDRTCEFDHCRWFEGRNQSTSSQGSDVERCNSSQRGGRYTYNIACQSAIWMDTTDHIPRGRDTNVLVLLHYFAGQLSGELWMRTAEGRNGVFVAVHDIR
ncbi:hypothetical protein GWK47_051903 [Chionoecetes opilio]|uniref:Uncharacterized protein n=1 Tax=Chionoecetes opilio TaxID=41210 RepID=A0A8J5CQF4_CHIOP|nr:hypothetical protein GWK47_051903 [Chionoecetes opilio]